MVVNYAKNKVAALVEVGGSVTDWRTFKFGTSGTATVLTDTALGAAIVGASVTGTVVRTNNQLAFSAQWTNSTGSSQTVREFGLFDGSGNMVARVATGDPDGFVAVEVPNGQTLYLDTYDLYVKDDSEV